MICETWPRSHDREDVSLSRGTPDGLPGGTTTLEIEAAVLMRDVLRILLPIRRTDAVRANGPCRGRHDARRLVVACETGEGAERLRGRKVERPEGDPNYLIRTIPAKGNRLAGQCFVGRGGREPLMPGLPSPRAWGFAGRRDSGRRTRLRRVPRGCHRPGRVE
jgi:hypothetical protein